MPRASHGSSTAHTLAHPKKSKGEEDAEKKVDSAMHLMQEGSVASAIMLLQGAAKSFPKLEEREATVAAAIGNEAVSDDERSRLLAAQCVWPHVSS